MDGYLVKVEPGRRARVIEPTNPYWRPDRDQGKEGVLGPFGLHDAISIAAKITVAAGLDVGNNIED